MPPDLVYLALGLLAFAALLGLIDVLDERVLERSRRGSAREPQRETES